MQSSIARASALLLASLFGSAHAGTSLTPAALVDRLLALTPADARRDSLIDTRKLVCEFPPVQQPLAEYQCSGSTLIALRDGVVTAELIVGFERGQLAHVFVKLPVASAGNLYHAAAQRLAAPCRPVERRRRPAEDGSLIGEEAVAFWLRPQEPRLFAWMQEPQGAELVGIAFVAAMGNNKGAQIERDCAPPG